MSDSHKKKSAEFAALDLEGLPRFAALSEASSSTKSIYFVRHGEAEHNVAPRPWGPRWSLRPTTPTSSGCSTSATAPAPRGGRRVLSR